METLDDWVNVAFANQVGGWCIGLAFVAILGALVAWMLAYRFLGRRIKADAALEWLLRWQEMNSFERWTLLQAYLRMNTGYRQSFRQLYSQLGCRVYKEFKGTERLILEMRGDGWLRSEIFQSWSEPPEPRMMRPLALARPMDNPHRPCTVPQLMARGAVRQMFGLAGILILVGGILLCL